MWGAALQSNAADAPSNQATKNAYHHPNEPVSPAVSRLAPGGLSLLTLRNRLDHQTTVGREAGLPCTSLRRGGPSSPASSSMAQPMNEDQLLPIAILMCVKAACPPLT